MQKGLSLAYNKDMQEDKEALFDVHGHGHAQPAGADPDAGDDEVQHEENMKQAALGGFYQRDRLCGLSDEEGRAVPGRVPLVSASLVAWCIARILVP